jgi:YbbR domain-containing protein
VKDKYLIIISIFIAIAIWLYVFASENRESTVIVPVNLVEIPEGTMASVFPREVSVRVRGPRSLIYNAEGANISIDINMSEQPIGTNILRLSPNDMRIPGVEIVEIVPARVELTLQETATVTLKLQPQLLGQPKRGYRVLNTKLTPEEAIVEGMPDFIGQIKAVNTKNINIDGIKETTTYSIEPEDYNGIKSIQPELVSVVVEIGENIVERSYVTHVTCADGTGTRADEERMIAVEVTVRGRIDLLESIQANTRLAEANCNILHDEEMLARLAANTPIKLQVTPRKVNGYEVIRIQPNVVEVMRE